MQATQLADTVTTMATTDMSVTDTSATNTPIEQSQVTETQADAQLSLFDLPDPIDPATKQVVEELKNTNVAGMTPLEALMKLNEWQQTIQ